MISRNSLGNAFPIKKLGDVVEFLDNQRRPVTESDRLAGIYPYFGANGKQGTIDNYIFDEPLVLLAEDGGHFDAPERGIAYRISGKTWVNNHAHVLRPKRNLDLGFLCRVLENYDVKPFVTGTTRGKLTKAGASEILIPLPPLPEQIRIAAILDQADALRVKRREALAELDSLTQSIYIEMFGDSANGTSKFPSVPFSNVCERIFKGAFDLNAADYQSEGIPFIRISNIQENTIDLSSAVYINQSVHARYQRSELVPGDVVFSKVGTIDRIAVIPDSITQCNISQNNVGAKLLRDVVEPLFAIAQLTTPFAINRIKAGSKKAVQDKLVLEELRALPFVLPPINEQKRFVEVVSSLNQIKASELKSGLEIDVLFASLQHRAFRGEL